MTTFKAVTSELKDTGINEMLKSGIDPLIASIRTWSWWIS